MCLLFLLGAHQAVGKWLLRAHAGGRKAETCCSKALNLGTPLSLFSNPVVIILSVLLWLFM